MILRYRPDAELCEDKITAIKGTACVGYLVWSTKELFADDEPVGTILHVWVHEDHRHQGIATAMLAEARRYDPRVCHSRERSDMGEAWASSLNEELPARAPKTFVRRKVKV